MKIRLLVDCEGPNPHYDPAQPADDDNPLNISIPAGTEIEDKMSWMLCFPEYRDRRDKLLQPEEIIRAEPIDEEAKRRVAYEDKKTGRVRGIAEVLALAREEAAVATEQAAAAQASAAAASH